MKGKPADPHNLLALAASRTETGWKSVWICLCNASGTHESKFTEAYARERARDAHNTHRLEISRNAAKDQGGEQHGASERDEEPGQGDDGGCD